MSSKSSDPLCSEWSATDLQQVLERVLLVHHHGNVKTLREKDMNLGYPVLLLVMASIELVSSLCYDGSSLLKPLDAYFDQYMSMIDGRYGYRYRQLKGITRDRKSPLSLKGSSRAYTNTGTILREAMRNRITHSCGSVIEIDSRQNSWERHLNVTGVPGFRTLFINAYRLFYDYLDSLKYLFIDLNDSVIFRNEFQRRLGREWAKIMLMGVSVNLRGV